MEHGRREAGAHVQSVERAAQLIDLLAGENRAMSLTEISRRIGWPKSTVHGLLATLRAYHYIDQSPTTGHYWLGVRLFELGHLVARSWDIQAVARPVMQRLSTLLGDTVQLAVEDKGEVLYLEKIDSTQMMRIVSEIGARLPMHCSGLGKVLLAHKPPAEVKWILGSRGMPAMTPRTITDSTAMDAELRKVRRQGYAIDDREIMDSLRCVAAPVYDREGQVRYAVSVSGFANSMQGEHLENATQLLLQATRDISYAMGYRPGDKL